MEPLAVAQTSRLPSRENARAETWADSSPSRCITSALATSHTKTAWFFPVVASSEPLGEKAIAQEGMSPSWNLAVSSSEARSQKQTDWLPADANLPPLGWKHRAVTVSLIS